MSAFNGVNLQFNTQTRIVDFFAGDTNNRGGIRVAVKNLDGDNLSDLLTGSGIGAGSHVTAYLGKTLPATTPTEQFAFDAYPGTTGGVFVG